MSDELTCARCGRAVDRSRDLYDTFEKMHWSCFHYEFEHFDGAGDPMRRVPIPHAQREHLTHHHPRRGSNRADADVRAVTK